MDELMVKIIELAIVIVFTLIARYVVPFIKQLTENEKIAAATSWIQDAVDAAEQTMKANKGHEKKAVVTEYLKKILTAKNISISDDQLDTMIEAAVFAMNQAKK